MKAVFVERFKRTLLDLIKEPMYIEGDACLLNHLDAALAKYKKRVRTTTRMTPLKLEMTNEYQVKYIAKLLNYLNFKW